MPRIKSNNICVFVRLFFNSRNRVLQFWIVGLFLITFFTVYHCITNNEIHQLIIPATRRLSPRIVARSILDASEEVPEPSSLINKFFVPNNHIESKTIIEKLALIWNKKTSVRNTNLEKRLKFDDETADHNKLISAIYEGGHSVPIPEKCPNFGSGLELLILIMSAPGNSEARTAIRMTWGAFGQRRDMSIAFLLGNTTDSNIEADLLIEQGLYGDNPRVRFVLKTDDDMFINVPLLLSFIKNHSEDSNVIYGRLAKGWPPIRDSTNKYHVPRIQYKPKIFPAFTTGPAYLLSSDVVPKLYNKSLEHRFVRLEDVFVTGIVAVKLGIKRIQADEFKNDEIPYHPCTVQRTISIHDVQYSKQFDLWKILLNGQNNIHTSI